MRDVEVSKFLSRVLRHDPGRIGVKLDESGWVGVDELLAKAAKAGKRISREYLEVLVRESDKQRFAFSEDGTRIRANQGHSVVIDLGLKPIVPPAELYHGTARHNLASIMESGLIKGRRHHVHLSADVKTAQIVGRRHGAVVVLSVDAASMTASGIPFFLSENGVWLVETVPPQYLRELP